MFEIGLFLLVALVACLLGEWIYQKVSELSQ